jgi:hypothetical protein
MQGGFRGTVVHALVIEKHRKPRRRVHQRGLGRLLLEEREEFFGNGKLTEIIRHEFFIDDIHVNLFELAEVSFPLYARIEHNAVEVLVRASDIHRECFDGVNLGDVKWHRRHLLVPISMYQFLQPFLASPDCSHIGTFIDAALCQFLIWRQLGESFVLDSHDGVLGEIVLARTKKTDVEGEIGNNAMNWANVGSSMHLPKVLLWTFAS